MFFFEHNPKTLHINIHLRHFEIKKDIFYEKNGPKFSIDTLNDNINNTKSFQ